MSTEAIKIIEVRDKDGKWKVLNFWTKNNNYVCCSDEDELKPVEPDNGLIKHNYLISWNKILEVLEKESFLTSRGLPKDTSVDVSKISGTSQWTYVTIDELKLLNKTLMYKLYTASKDSIFSEDDDEPSRFEDIYSSIASINETIGFAEGLADEDGFYGDDVRLLMAYSY